MAEDLPRRAPGPAPSGVSGPPGPVAGAGRAEDVPVGEGADGVERALLRARALIESTMSLCHRGPGHSSAVLQTEELAPGLTAEHLVRNARYSVSVSLPVVAGHSPASPRVLDSLEEAIDKGVTVRLLCGPRVPVAEASCLPRLRDAAYQVRVANGDLRRTMVVDGRLALVQPTPGPPGRLVALIRDAASVRALDLLFAGAWGNARPVTEGSGISGRLRSEAMRHTLRHLCAGHTDEVAAREIGMSLRTYRRHVAEIMRELGANSRFQAGVRAVELGLLTEDGENSF